MVLKLKEIYKNDKLLLNILLFFIIIQPFLDIEIFFTDNRFSIFGFTIPTLVRYMSIAILTLLSLKNIKKDKEHKIYFWYFLILFIYMLIHHFINSSSGTFPGSFYYSLKEELFYISRMLFPFLIIYITKYSNITLKQFSCVIIWVSLIISTIIVSSNMLKISLTAYASDSLFNKINWIEWFSKAGDYGFEELTSKGWFYSANQISGLMVLLLPFNIYSFLKKENTLSYISTPLLILAMILMATRISSYGWILISISMIILMINFKYISKEKILSKNLFSFIAITIVFLILLFFSPIQNRKYVYENNGSDDIEIIKPDDDNLDLTYEFILNNYAKFGVQKFYITKLYPYEFDYIFWLDIFEKSREFAIDNRQMQKLISSRIVSLNNNSFKNMLFGYSFSKFRNGGVYIEHDFQVQYVTMGIIGCILLIGPYFYFLIYCLYKIFKDKTKLNYLNITLIMSILIVLMTAFITGHILDELIVTIFIAFILGFLVKNVLGDELVNES